MDLHVWFVLQINQGRADSDLSIQTGNFGRVPPELFQNILRFLSSEVCCHCDWVPSSFVVSVSHCDLENKHLLFTSGS